MKLEEKLIANGQGHLLDMKDLSAEERAEYLRQLGAIDFDVINCYRHPMPEKRGKISPIKAVRTEDIERQRERFEEVGKGAIRAGKVAAVLLAGGQGTRLGADGPKGAFDLGVTKPVYIFQLLIANLLEVCARCGAHVPLLVMTSEKNDAATRAFLRDHAYFGYPPEYVRFFVQEMHPSVDLDGKILLEGKGRLALSPGGNGGWFASLQRAGTLAEFPALEWLNVFAVDNVLQRIADPAFLGATILSGMPCGAKVVMKSCPEERVGVLCLEDGRPSVIEYYELPRELAELRDGAGRLTYGCGVILNYLFSLEKLREIAGTTIPVHVAKKKIDFMNAEGELVRPQTENGYKFETLILDMVRLCGACLPFEVVREREFAPVKNRTGTDSVETARALLKQNGREL